MIMNHKTMSACSKQ